MNVTRFAMGSPIPEWLLSADPTQAGAPKGNFRFAVDVDVFETETYYLVLPLAGGPYPIDMSGMAGHNVYATAKDVRVALAWGAFGTLSNQQWVHVPPGVTELAQSMQAPPAQLGVSAAPERTFWQRVRYAFTGR